MIMNVMDEIKQIEEQPQDKKRQAMEKARPILNQAEQDGENLISSTIQQAQQEKKQFIKQAEEEAEKENQELNRKTDMECQKIRQFARSRMDDAISLVMGKVVKTHGHN